MAKNQRWNNLRNRQPMKALIFKSKKQKKKHQKTNKTKQTTTTFSTVLKK